MRRRSRGVRRRGLRRKKFMEITQGDHPLALPVINRKAPPLPPGYNIQQACRSILKKAKTFSGSTLERRWGYLRFNVGTEASLCLRRNRYKFTLVYSLYDLSKTVLVVHKDVKHIKKIRHRLENRFESILNLGEFKDAFGNVDKAKVVAELKTHRYVMADVNTRGLPLYVKRRIDESVNYAPNGSRTNDEYFQDVSRTVAVQCFRGRVTIRVGNLAFPEKKLITNVSRLCSLLRTDYPELWRDVRQAWIQSKGTVPIEVYQKPWVPRKLYKSMKKDQYPPPMRWWQGRTSTGCFAS
eukprot:RCo012441